MADLKSIDKALSSYARKGASLKADAVKLAVMILDHYVEHGDYTRLEKMQSLVKANHGGSVLQAFNTYVANAMPSLVWNDELKTFQHQKGMKREWATFKIEAKGDKPAYEGSARDYSFFDMERPVSVKPFVFEDRFSNLIKQAETEYEKTVKAGTPNLVLRAQLDILKGLHLENVKVMTDKEGHAEVVTVLETNTEEMPSVAA